MWWWPGGAGEEASLQAAAACMRVRAVSHVALGEENAHTAAASASAIATAARGQTKERARGRSAIQRALLAAKFPRSVWEQPSRRYCGASLYEKLI